MTARSSATGDGDPDAAPEDAAAPEDGVAPEDGAAPEDGVAPEDLAASQDSAASESSATAGGTDDEPPAPPGPDGLPFVGSLVPLLRDPFSFYDDLAAYGDVVRYRVAGRTFTGLLHPDHVERVLVREHDRFERWVGAELGLDFAPEGVLFADGEQWRRQRRLLQPAFTMDRIESYADAMVEYAVRATDEWPDGGSVTLNRAFSDLTLRILSKALFDLDVDPAAEDGAIPRAARVINERAGPGRNVTALLPDWLPTPANRRYRRAMADYRERVDELVARRRTANRGDEPGDDLLSILLSAGGPDGDGLSDAELRDNLLTLTFAGHETTSLGLTYACLLLARHDDAAATLREELDAVVGDGTPGVEHVPELEYTEGVVREAMRLYPPSFVLFRRATEDAVVGGYRVPEDSFLVLPQFALHTDGRFWDAPGEFRPARWADDDPERPEYAYFPFGGGPRHCLGMRFAMLELQLVLAVVARRFELTLLSDPDPALSAGVTLQPTEDVRVRVRRRG